MSKEIVDFIKATYKEKTTEGSPSTNTDLTNSLELLSSGIYTEEERFIFELLQNAVDAFCDEKGVLNIKIIVLNNLVVFMHNGQPFSTRDIEGICSVGNGDKATDISKIGYKGIGFKSVFMHTKHVSIQTGDTIFGFEEKHWANYYKNTSQTGRVYKMPWQIIPILEENPPIKIETRGYNVITYLRTENTVSIASKVEKLMSNCQFLLFLKHDNININYEVNSTSHSISKYSQTARELAFSTIEQNVRLTQDGKNQSAWIVYKNERVPIPNEYAPLIEHDQLVPEKLKSVNSFDLSFAIQLDNKNHFKPIEKSVLYTYLPTSCSVNLPFIVNANYITDAGRQQLNTVTSWNQMVISEIPQEYIKWMSKLSQSHKDYYKVLPSKKFGIDDFEKCYKNQLEKALEEIPFVPALHSNNLLIVSDTISDKIGLSDAISKQRFNTFLSTQYGKGYSIDSLIDPEAGEALRKFDAQIIEANSLEALLEEAPKFLEGFTTEECVKLCKFLANDKDKELLPAERLCCYPFLIDEKNELVPARKLFFPSEYRNKKSIARSAKVISADLIEGLEKANLKKWLVSLGVQEMSNLSVIQKVICSGTFFDEISKEEAIKAIQFIFDSEKNEPILDEICNEEVETLSNCFPDSSYDKSHYPLKRCDYLKLLSKNNNINSPSWLLLNRKDYGYGIEAELDVDIDLFVSDEYIREGDDKLEWAMFFKKIGVRDKFELVYKRYERDSDLWEKFTKFTTYANEHETNTSCTTGRTFSFWSDKIEVETAPILSVTDNSHKVCKMVWNSVFASPVLLSSWTDNIRGHMGFWDWSINLTGEKYLGENFLPYALKTFKWLPGSDGQLYSVKELLENTTSNRAICGEYYPTLDVDCEIDESWMQYLPFKKSLSLEDYLTILERIEQTGDEGISCEGISQENQDRISLIYSQISKLHIEEGTTNYDTITKWAKTHRILASDLTYKSPKDLLLLSDNLGQIELNNIIYKGKHIEKLNPHFISFMKALGVKYVDKFTCNFDEGVENYDIKDKLLSISGFLTLLSLAKEIKEDYYNKELKKIKEIIESFTFIENRSITVTYAGQSVERSVFVKENEFHYVAPLSIAKTKLMLDAIAEKLSIKSDLATMLVIIQMDDQLKIQEYLQEEGYNSSFVKIEKQDILTATLSEDYSLGEYERIEYNEEAKKIVLQKLSNDGFDTSKAESICSIVNGVKKNGEEFPIVIKSYINHSYPFHINPNEWTQLMRSDKSMLLIHSGNRVVENVKFSNLFINQDNVSFKFSVESLGNIANIYSFAEILKYFKGCTFDFKNIITTRYEEMKNYKLNENNPNAFIDKTPDDTKLLD